MHQIVDQLNSKLLALTAQLGALRSDIDGLESEFIELSKDLSDLSAQLEAAAPDPEIAAEFAFLTSADVRDLADARNLSFFAMCRYLVNKGYSIRHLHLPGTGITRVWVHS